MKKEYFILPIVAAGAVSFSSCSKKESEAQNKPEVQEPTTEVAAEPVKADAKLDLEVLAAKAGFAKHLPKSADGLWTLYDAAGMIQKLRGSKLGVFVERMAAGEGADLDELLEMPEYQQFIEVAGEELFFATGEGTAAQTGNLLEVSAASNYHQMRSMVELVGQSLNGNAAEFDDEEYIKDWMQDPRTLEVFKNSEMPPVYMGFKVSDKEKRDGYVAMIQGFIGGALDSQDEGEEFMVSTEKDGFTGFTVKGEMIVKLLENEDKSEAIEILGEEKIDAYLAELKKKDVTVLAGSFGDYVVMFAGQSADQLRFAESVEDSVLAHKGMEFAHQYSGKEIAGLAYCSEAVYSELVQHQSGLADMARGVIEGLKASDAFGDTRVLEALLGDLIQREKDYYAPFKPGRLGAVAMFDEGFKVETYYGGNAPGADLTAKRHLAKVAEGEGVLFSANWVCNPQQTERALKYLDAAGSTGYEASKLFAGFLGSELAEELDMSDLEEFSEGFEMFESMMKKDALQLWSAIRHDLSNGLGAESAMVIDINGELPTVPMIPEPMLKEGKVPRFSYLSTVKDRKKLGESWEKLNATAENVLKVVSELGGTPIPMQRPFKNESNGLASWTFQMPFAHQNCIPNISVSDDLFIVGTSSDFSAELAKSFEKDASGEPLAEMQFNFAPARTLSSQWMELMAKHGEELMGELDQESFLEAKTVFDGLLEATSDWEYIRVESKQEGDDIRGTFHFKTK